MKTVFTSFLFILISSLIFQINAQVWEAKAISTLPENYYVSNISVVSEQVIWAVAIDYSVANPPIPSDHITKILKSTSGGDSWEVIDIEEIMGRVSWDMHAFDENRAIITTQNLQSSSGRGLWETTDGGETWTEMLPGNAGGVWIHFFDDQEGICINGRTMARTEDSGMTWGGTLISEMQNDEGTIIASGETSLETLGDILWFGTDKGRIFKSYDRGQNWEAFSSGLGDDAIFISTAFVNEKNGIAVYFIENTSDYLFARTSDGGESWTPADIDFEFNEVTSINCTRTFMGVSWEDNITAISTDLGLTWELLDDQTSAWTPVFNSPNLGWMGEGDLNGLDAPALHKWVGDPVYGRAYVNQNANGNNDGSSWADAYTDLQEALAAAQEGDEIWVAAGTYQPGSDPTSTFLINKNLQLYGGFFGSECDLSERDHEENPTILSGDINNDDLGGDFDNFKSDNVMTVMTITTSITNETLIDGFTIRNGHADGVTDNSQTRGGAIYSNGAPIVRNCFFTQNYASSQGGAVRVQNQMAGGITFEACVFRNNHSEGIGDSDGGAIAASDVNGDGIIILQSIFDNNRADWASGVWFFNSNVYIDGSTFTDNFCDRQAGALRFSSNASRTLSVKNSIFEGNSAAFGGGIYALANGDDINIEIVNTIFKENSSAPVFDGWGSGGGGFCSWINNTAENTNITFDQCTFENNTTGGSGGGAGLHNEGNFTNVVVKNTSFTENESGYHGGGLRFLTAENSNHSYFTVDSCDFSLNHNEMWTGGGFRGIFLGFNSNLTLSNSTFTENSTGLSGGGAAIYGFTSSATGVVNVTNNSFDNNNCAYEAGLSVGSGTDAGFFQYNISDCTITNNHSTIEGGGIGLFNERSGKYLVENCIIEGNSSDGSYGGITIYNTSPGMDATVKNCKILNNEANFGAGIGGYPFSEEPEDLMNTIEATIHFENCLIAGNTGSGGTVGFNQTGNVSFLNCTIADNPAGGISLDSSSLVTLQNTILHNSGSAEYVDLTGTSSVNSSGGNLFRDNSIPTANEYDILDVDPLFAGVDDFHLHDNSPAIDAGIDLGNLPDFDIEGNEVVNCIDIGAYQSSIDTGTDCLVVGTKEVLANNYQLNLSPNPARDFLNVEFPEDTNQNIEVSLFDPQGRRMYDRVISAGQNIDLNDLAKGMYLVKAVVDGFVYTGKFVKQ